MVNVCQLRWGDRCFRTTSGGATAVREGPGRARREGDQLREELLASAAALAAGPRPVAVPSLRAVARACGVSATAVYRHFPSQSALTRAVLVAEHAAFVRAVLAADDASADPASRLRRLAAGYVAWGTTHPGPYQLLFESADQLGEDWADPRGLGRGGRAHDRPADRPGRGGVGRRPPRRGGGNGCGRGCTGWSPCACTSRPTPGSPISRSRSTISWAVPPVTTEAPRTGGSGRAARGDGGARARRDV